MPTFQELERAFLNAHKAGDRAAASALASEIRRFAAVEEPAPEAKKPEPEPETGFIAGAKAGFQRLLGDYEALKAAGDVEGAEQKAKEYREEAARIYKQPELLEAPWEYLKGLAGQSAAYMALPLAAGAATAAAAPTAIAGLAATGATFIASALQFSGSNLSRQLEENVSAKDLKVLNAVAAAVPQAALDTISLRMVPGLRNIFTKAGVELSEKGAAQLAKESLVISLAKGVPKTSGIEGLTESAQAVLERAQAGLNLTDAGARREYFDNFIGGVMLGGAISVPGTIYEKGKAQAEIAAKEAEAERATQTAQQEAAKISQTAVPDETGKVPPPAAPAPLPTFEQRPPGAVSTAAAELDVDPTIALAEAKAGPTLPRAKKKDETAEDEYLRYNEMLAAGVDSDGKTLPKQRIESITNKLANPKYDEFRTPSKKEAVDVTQSAGVDTTGAEPSLDGTPSGMGAAAAGAKALASTGVDDAGRLAPQPPAAKGEQPAALKAIPYDTVEFVGEGQPVRRSSGESSVINYGGRMMVTRDVNGVTVPFYLSTGSGGKADVPAGKWYPFFGVGSDGWINKTGGKEMANYYGSEALKQAAQELDATVGDIRNDDSVPKVSRTGQHIDFINRGFSPAENQKEDTLIKVRENIDRVVSAVEKEKTDVTETPEAVETEAQGQEQAAFTPSKRVITLEEEKTAPAEKHSPEQSAYLQMKTDTRAAPAASIKEGMGYAAAETAFDFYDSAFANIEASLKDQVAAENAARQAAYEEAAADGKRLPKPEPATTLDILQKMSETERAELFRKNVNSEKLNKSRRTQMNKRVKFLESLTDQQREAVRKQAIELFDREVRAVKNIGRTTTEADLRKSREQAARESVEKQLEEIEKPTRKAAPTKPKTGPTQVETLEQKRDSTIRKALESGDVGSIFAAIANERINDSVTAFFARKLYDVLKTFDTQPTVVLGKVEDGRAGKYDPSTETITIDLENLGKDRLDIVTLHEFTHFMADHAIDNRKSLTREQQNALNKLDNLYRYVNSQLGKRFDIGSLKEFVAEAFSNPEFQKAMGNLKPMETEGKKQNVFSLFAKRIMEMLGFRNRLLSPEELAEVGGTYGAVLGDVLTQIEQIIKADRVAPAVGVSYMAKQAKPPIAAPAEGSTNISELRDTIPSPSFNARNVVKTFNLNKFVEGAVRIFQNDRAAIKNWQRRMWLTGRYMAYGVGFNNIYDQITLSSGNAHWLYTQYVQEDNEAVRKAVADYAKERGLDVDTALKELGMYAVALHEPERRETLYLRTVDLTDTETLTNTVTGKPISPRAARDAIFEYLDTNKLDESGAKYLRAQLEKIVNDKDNLGPEAVPRDDQKFAVAGYTTAQIDAIKSDYEKHKAAADKVLDRLKAVNKATLELNAMANYMSEYANNYIMFYGYDHYVPFKGKNFNEDKADIFNHDGRKLGGDFQEDIHTFEGRLTVPDNPILQVMADGAKSAMRAGRKDVTQAIYNAVKEGSLAGEIMKFGKEGETKKDYIDFKDRANDDLLQQLKGETRVFHYMPDGKVAVIQINDKNQREAIRRSYRDTNPAVDFMLNKMNTLTGLAGQFHTRYKLTFAPVNFVRDVLTNAWAIGAEGKGLLGPLQSFRYLGSIALDIVKGDMRKSMNFARLYSKGDTKKIEALAKNDTYYKDLMDYVKTGGKVSYIQGIAPKGQLDELLKTPGGKLFDTEKIKRLFDIWIDTFEMTSRVAAFRLTKANETARLSKDAKLSKVEVDEAATKTAAAYAKNLANFEQVGEWGRALGGLFMFYRPSATGAVRAMDAIAPAFQNKERVKLSLPEFAQAAQIRQKLKGSVTDTERQKLESKLAELDKALDAFDKNYAQLQTSARIIMGALIGAGVVTYMMAQSSSDDDELERNRVSTDDMARWTKFARFHIPGFETPVQLPWGFGLGAFAALGAQLAAMSDGRNPTKTTEIMGNMLTITLDSFMPLPFSRIPLTESPGQFTLDSVLPSVVRPVFEYYMNMDALGHQIYNNRQSKYGDAYTGGDNIPEAYKAATRYLAETTNGALNWSPNTMYFFFNNYADGVASLVNSPVNMALWLSGKKEFNAHTDTMFLDSFFGTRSNFDARQWSKIEADLKERSEKIKMFKPDPVQYYKYLAANPFDEMLVKMYDGDANKQLKDLREEANKWRTARGLDIRTRTELVKNAVLQQNLLKYSLIQKYKAFGIEP